MKISDLRPCANCGGKITGPEGRCPQFYVLKFSTALLNPREIQRQMAGAEYVGHFGIAQALGMVDSQPVATIIGDEEGGRWLTIYLCQECYIMKPINLLELIEKAQAQEK